MKCSNIYAWKQTHTIYVYYTNDFCVFSWVIHFFDPLPLCFRLVQSALHKFHSQEAYLLLHASDILPHHADGDAVLGVFLDRQESCTCSCLSGYWDVSTWPPTHVVYRCQINTPVFSDFMFCIDREAQYHTIVLIVQHAVWAHLSSLPSYNHQ